MGFGKKTGEILRAGILAGVISAAGCEKPGDYTIGGLEPLDATSVPSEQIKLKEELSDDEVAQAEIVAIKEAKKLQKTYLNELSKAIQNYLKSDDGKEVYGKVLHELEIKILKDYEKWLVQNLHSVTLLTEIFDKNTLGDQALSKKDIVEILGKNEDFNTRVLQLTSILSYMYQEGVKEENSAHSKKWGRHERKKHETAREKFGADMDTLYQIIN